MEDLSPLIIKLIKKTLFAKYPQIISVTVDRVEDVNFKTSKKYDRYYVGFNEDQDDLLNVKQRNEIRREVVKLFDLLGADEDTIRFFVFFKSKFRYD